MNACDYVIIDNCTMNNNVGYGFAGSTASNSNQQFGMTNFVINASNAVSNTVDGIKLSGFNKNGIISNCILTFKSIANVEYCSKNDCHPPYDFNSSYFVY